MKTIQKSEIPICVRKVIEELGVATTYGKARVRYAQKFKASLSDATFYRVRQQMRDEQKPAILPLSHTQTKPGVLELVKAAQKLITSMSKDDAKALIDSL